MRKLVVLCLAVGLAGASNFYIFYRQVGANPNCPGLSIDQYNNASAHIQWRWKAPILKLQAPGGRASKSSRTRHGGECAC